MRSIKVMTRLRSAQQDGATLVLVAGLTVMFVAFVALAVDIAHLLAVRNELHNAADAGALAGARFLYNDNGTVNSGANLVAKTAAMENDSERVPAEVNWTAGQNDGSDVERGHWRFSDRQFFPAAGLSAPDLWGQTNEELDNDLTFVNAVRVKTSRVNTQADSFFARILGYAGFNVRAEAVAYIGFAGTTQPLTVDLPIAICKQALLQNGTYQCSIGRMINSGPGQTTNTGAWTDYTQESGGCGATNANLIKNITRSCPIGENGTALVFGEYLNLNNGQIGSAFGGETGQRGLWDCWAAETGRTRVWRKTLPVIDCPGYPGPVNCSNTSTSAGKLVGVVTVDILWINPKEDPSYSDAPRAMEAIDMEGTQYDRPAFTSTAGESGLSRWTRFVSNYSLQKADGTPVDWMNKTIYLLPQCSPQLPRGVTGGTNFGILSKIPVLVN